MEAELLINRMEAFPRALDALLRDVPEEQARWKPPSGAWSLLEIVRHLGDEEVDDFRTRLRLTLEDASQAWPQIDPEGVAVERNYNEGDLREALDALKQERAASIEWLRSLDDPDWYAQHKHPSFGLITSGDLLTSWCAHDALHLRQIAKRLFGLAERDGGGAHTDYAGEWTA